MNKNGFTLIEILAAIVILGIVSAIGIAAVSNNIVESRKSTYVNLARQLADSARDMRGKDKLPKDIKNGEALVIPCYSLTGKELDLSGGTGFGDIVQDYCYVGIVNKNSEFSYYVTSVDTANHGFVAVEASAISKDRLVEDEDLINSESLLPTSGALSAFKVTYDGTLYTVKGVRIKAEAASGDTITAYYSNDGSTSSAQVVSTLSNYDNFISSKKLVYKGVTYTIRKYEITYIYLSKDV